MTAPLWIPGAIHKPIPKTSTDPFIIPIGDVFHVAVSEASSLREFFGRDGGIESTGYIRRDGTVEQYRPLNVECDAQNDGNSWVSGGKRYGFNSWETQGMGEGEWTPQQLDAIKKIIAFKHAKYGTPLRLCPDWNAAGFGYHRLFQRWNKNGHSCPGPDRVKQFNQIIVPWMKQGGSTQEEDMPLLTDADVNKIVKALLDAPVVNRNPDGSKGQGKVGAILTNIEESQESQYNKLAERIDNLTTLLQQAVDAGKSDGR